MGFKEEWIESVLENSNELILIKNSKFERALDSIKTGICKGTPGKELFADALYAINIYIPILIYLNCKIINAKSDPGINTKELNEVREDIIKMFKQMEYIPSAIKNHVDNDYSGKVNDEIEICSQFSNSESIIYKRYLSVYKLGKLLSITSEIVDNDVIKLYSQVRLIQDNVDNQHRDELNKAKILAEMDVQKIKQKTN